MKRAELCLLLAIGLCLLAMTPAAFGPLQIGDDSAEYLAMAAVKADGYPFPHTRLPVGFPALVATLDRGGFATQAEFVALSLIGLVVALTAFCKLMRGRLSNVEMLAICLATLLYRVTITQAAVPQPDLLFFAVSMLALACLAKPSSANFVIGLGLCVPAVSLRSIGLALFLPTVWAVARSNHRVTLGCLATGAWVAILMTLVKWNGYVVGFAGPPYRSLGVVRVLWMDTTWRFQEVATIATNLEHPFWHALQLSAWLGLLSAVFCLFLAIGLWNMRGSIAAVYFASYLGILIVWPACIPRFWVPVLPLALSFTWVGAKLVAKKFQGSPKVSIAALAAYLVWYTAMGIDGLYHGIEYSRGEAADELAKQQHLTLMTTAELAALDLPDFALTPHTGLAAHRYAREPGHFPRPARESGDRTPPAVAGTSGH